MMKKNLTPSKDNPYTVKKIIKKADELTQEDIDLYNKTINESKIGKVNAMMVKKMTEENLSVFSTELKEALRLSGSVIVDAGLGIGELIEAASFNKQIFSTTQINEALLATGLIQEGITMKMGAAATPISETQPAEIIESMLFYKDQTKTTYIPETKVAWTDQVGQLHIEDYKSEKRMLLEHTFLISQSELNQSNALALKIAVEKERVDICKQLAQAADFAGLKNYTIRCIIRGGIQGQLGVIHKWPTEKIKSMEEVISAQAIHEMTTESTFYFFGTRSEQGLRKNKRWGEISGNEIYAPEGHHHGYSTDGKGGAYSFDQAKKRSGCGSGD